MPYTDLEINKRLCEMETFSKFGFRSHDDQKMLEQVFRERNDLRWDYNECQRLTREIDIFLNGEKGRSRQASLCDIFAQVCELKTIVTSLTEIIETYRQKLNVLERKY